MVPAPQIHAVHIEPYRETADRYAVCSCGWESQPWHHPAEMTLVCDVWKAQEEGRRNTRMRTSMGG